MNIKRMLLLDVLIVFTLFTVYAVYQSIDLAAMWAALTAHAAVAQIFFDLLICLGLAAIWLWNDAKERNISPMPYIIGMMLTGSIALLFYIYRHVLKKEEEKSMGALEVS